MKSLVERHSRDDSLPADSDIAEMSYSTDKHTLSINYHAGSTKVVSATRHYFKLVHGDGLDDDIEWNPRHHTVYHVNLFNSFVSSRRLGSHRFM